VWRVLANSFFMQKFQWSSRGAQKNNALAECSKNLSSQVAASEGPRRYRSHFVEPFVHAMDLGERENPSSDSGVREALFGTLRV